MKPAVIQSLRWLHMADDALNVQRVRDACRRIGLSQGDRVIDVGCGPLGALHVLREIAGTVAGLDANEEVLGVARGALDRRGLHDVTLTAKDINELAPGELGMFDAAFCRLLLINQPDPAHTLRHMASLVRPGGHVIAHELLDDAAFPMFDPPVPAFARLRVLWRELLSATRIDAARHLDAFAREAGLDPVSQQGFFNADPRDAAAFIQSDGLGVLLSIAPALRQQGLATEREISGLATELQAATAVPYRTFFSWVFIELIARVKAEGRQKAEG